MNSDNKIVPGLSLFGENLQESPRDKYIIDGYACRVAWDWELERQNKTSQVLSEFSSKWIVPPPPRKQAQQIIFLFNAMVLSSKLIDNTYPEEPIFTKAIIQPVLQWGYDGCPSWSISSWYVKTKSTTRNIIKIDASSHTFPIKVTPGDTVIGLIRQKKQARNDSDVYQGDLYTCTCEFDGIAGTGLAVQSTHEFVRIGLALETYKIEQCDELPDTEYTSYTDITVKQEETILKPNWSDNPFNVKKCNIRSEVLDDSQIKIYYK